MGRSATVQDLGVVLQRWRAEGETAVLFQDFRVWLFELECLRTEDPQEGFERTAARGQLPPFIATSTPTDFSVRRFTYIDRISSKLSQLPQERPSFLPVDQRSKAVLLHRHCGINEKVFKRILKFTARINSVSPPSPHFHSPPLHDN